jgi:hypothetical protein
MCSQSEYPVCKTPDIIAEKTLVSVCFHTTSQYASIKKKRKPASRFLSLQEYSNMLGIYKMHTFNAQQLRCTDWREGESG